MSYCILLLNDFPIGNPSEGSSNLEALHAQISSLSNNIETLFLNHIQVGVAKPSDNIL